MTSYRKILPSIVLFLSISACSTTPETVEQIPPPVAENPAIIQARADLQQARDLRAEWLVRLQPQDDQRLTLGAILQMAETAQEAGDIERASALAAKVTLFARLGIAQAEDQRNAAPFYPR